MKTISLDLHDFSVLNSRLDLLLKIKEHYPDFKVSCFTVPVHGVYEMGQGRMYREKTLAKIHEHLDWIQIIPHGLTHMEAEFEHCDRWTMKMVLEAIDEAFTKDGLPYTKGFCAPYWLWSQEVVDVLDEAGWWGAIDRNQPDMLRPKRFYVYSHSLDEPYWESDLDVLKLHGHLDGQSPNDLERCLLGLLKLPSDVQWKFVSEMVEGEQ